MSETRITGAVMDIIDGVIKPRDDMQIVLPQVNDSTKPSLAFGDGDTGIYEGADDSMRVSIAGVFKYLFAYGYFLIGTVQISTSTATSTFPNIYPSSSDTNTGLGHAGADQLSLIAGGVEGIRVTEVGGAISISGDGVDVVSGLAVLDSNGYVNAKGRGINLTRDGGNNISITERTSGETALFITRNGANDYKGYIKSGGVDKNIALRVGSPATATSTGKAGDIAYDSSYFYVCTATNVWKRAAIGTW